MKKLFGLAAVLMLLAGIAWAGVTYTWELGSGIIYQHSVIDEGSSSVYCDSSTIRNVMGASSVWLSFSSYPAVSGGLDTTAVYAVTVKWYEGDPDVDATYADSMHVHLWTVQPSPVRTSACLDTVAAFISSGQPKPTTTTCGGNEIRVTIGASQDDPDNLGTPNNTTFILANQNTPFVPKYIQFKWRLIAGPAFARYRALLVTRVD